MGGTGCQTLWGVRPMHSALATNRNRFALTTRCRNAMHAISDASSHRIFLPKKITEENPFTEKTLHLGSTSFEKSDCVSSAVKVVAGILSLKPIVSDVEVPGSCLEGRLVLPAGDDVCLHAAPAARETRPPPEHPFHFHGANRQSLFRRMSSRLRRVTNWAELAEESSYSAKILADRCGVSLRQLERYIDRKSVV